MASAIKAINFIKKCSDKFKAILVIDHKPEIIQRCDYLIEFGPGAGPEGGKIIFSGLPTGRS